jgi:hypothetical protein
MVHCYFQPLFSLSSSSRYRLQNILFFELKVLAFLVHGKMLMLNQLCHAQYKNRDHKMGRMKVSAKKENAAITSASRFVVMN